MNTPEHLNSEIKKRRTFAIISHPDAGKTTLTEKLLLYAGMVRTAGMVRGRKNRKGASSDWMKMEAERGISITSSVMQFPYKGKVINVLDTPGHQDFSEDTYRTLTAADSAVMVIDAGKGIEKQTLKLFQVCKMRNIPIFTFINKLDLPGREPLDLLGELEEVLGIQSTPLNWPIGSGKEFKGVIDLATETALLFKKDEEYVGSAKIDFETKSLSELLEDKSIHKEILESLTFELELLREAGNKFDKELFLAGQQTPVCFGSGLTNFGVEFFFDTFSDLAPYPMEREIFLKSGEKSQMEPSDKQFSGYVFKIQANMDPRHRDSMAFIRVCSGYFDRENAVMHSRTGKKVRLSRSHAMFGGNRETVDKAVPGDIVGVVNPGVFAIGDTISTNGGFNFKSLPKFPPEVVAKIRPKDVGKHKSFKKGLEQFRSEGAVLILDSVSSNTMEPLIAAVGVLQFEVLESRFKNEYNVDVILEYMSYKFGSWLIGDVDKFEKSTTSMLAKDALGNVIVLYTHEWEKEFLLKKNPDHTLEDFIES